MNLLPGIKAAQMRMIIDLVVNHTSDEHFWFLQSRAVKHRPYTRLLCLARREEGNAAEQLSFVLRRSAWKRDDPTGPILPPLFAEKQPDLNWENPQVRQEVYGLMSSGSIKESMDSGWTSSRSFRSRPVCAR